MFFSARTVCSMSINISSAICIRSAHCRVVLVTATIYITLNLIADLAYILVNSRSRVRK